MNESPILILLAGGKSVRMGFPKGLLDFYGTPWILEQLSRYNHVKNPKVYIGLGYNYEHYFKAIPWFTEAIDDFYFHDGVEVRVIINHQPHLGAFSTLQAVLDVVDKYAIILVQPVDVPLLNEQGVIAIINENNSIVIPKCDAKNGHPVKLKSIFWNTLLSIDSTSKEARLDLQIKTNNRSSITFLNVTDKSIYQNINTKNDWKIYLKSNL